MANVGEQPPQNLHAENRRGCQGCSPFLPFALTTCLSSLCRQLLNTDFVTWRGHLTKVLTTPYERQDGWLLAVSLFHGTLYISEVETESSRRQREQRSEMLKELTYMGYKFEHYMCAGEFCGALDRQCFEAPLCPLIAPPLVPIYLGTPT